LILLCLGGARPARALDLFTLWRQPEIPLQISEGSWVEYRTQVMAGGRQEESLTRIVCLDREHGSDDATWLLELLPLVEEDGRTRPLPGEGMHLRLSRSLLSREGTFMEAIVSAVQWREGQAQKISPAELQEDPLVAATLAASFTPDRTEIKDPTTRIVSGEQFLCEQFVMSAADTQVAVLPAGRMIQVTTREIVAAVHEKVPFLGLTYLSERVRAESRLDPPSRRIKAPPARIRVEVMELVAFGHGAVPVFAVAD
jgi:hypothetical protein